MKNDEAKTHDEILSDLAERTVLASAVCIELRRSDCDSSPGSMAALRLLIKWIRCHYSLSGPGDTDLGYGLLSLEPASDDAAEFARLVSATQVAKNFAIMLTADSNSEYNSDMNYLHESLTEYIALGF